MSTESLIASLLFEAESSDLDFKRDPYPFEGADDRAKSELLKDILAFANAWRRTDAYILIGVQEVPESEAEVVGIEAHIDDAKLQQFVNSKTNRPIEFSYVPTLLKGKQVGVIHIPVQDRPTFLTKDYGALRRNTVYLRRGSSTDEARPDEIARMGQAVSEAIRPKPLLVPLIATGADWSDLGLSASFETTIAMNLNIKTLPDYSPPQEVGPYGMTLPTFHRHANSSFYRERAEYLRFNAKLRAIRFCIRNDGTALASGVKFTLQIVDPSHSIELALGSDRPVKPKAEWSPIDSIPRYSTSHPVPDIEFNKTKIGWTVSAHFIKVQAKDTVLTSETLLVGVNKSSSVEMSVSVFADELSNPVTSDFSLKFTVEELEVDVSTLID